MATLDKTTRERLAEHLDAAERNAAPVSKITDDYPDMDWEDAYDIQWEIRRLKLARGHRIAGLKMGLTSWAKMKQMGVDTPIYAFLADYFSVDEGAAIDTSQLIHPKIEAEIAVVTKAPLRGPGCSIAQVMAAVGLLMPALEVIDSRYENFRFDLKSVVADNASSARFVSGGTARGIDGLDLKSLQVTLEKNGKEVGAGSGADVLGHPLASVAMLANMLSTRDEEIPAGTLVLTGGITAAIAVEPGDEITARYDELGTLSTRFE